MKTEVFKKTIGDHLQQRAETDPLFAETLKKPNKNLDDCVKYIINRVKKSGENVFADDEIFGMAVHYYDEDNIDVGPEIKSGSVSVSQSGSKKDSDPGSAKKQAKSKAPSALDEIQAHLF